MTCIAVIFFFFFVADPLRTTQGFLSLKAYRLTPEMMKFYKESDFTPENMAKHGINFETILQEIPIVLRNSHLVNALLCEISEKTKKDQKFSALDLGTRFVIFHRFFCSKP